MGQDLGLDGHAGVFPLSDRFVEMGGIPVNDDGREEVELGHAVMLALAGAVADLALASDPERVLERVMSLDQALAAVREGDTLVVPKLDTWPGPSRMPAPSPTCFRNAA